MLAQVWLGMPWTTPWVGDGKNLSRLRVPETKIGFRQKTGDFGIVQEMNDGLVLFHPLNHVSPDVLVHLLLPSPPAFFPCQGFFPPFLRFRMGPELFPLFRTGRFV